MIEAPPEVYEYCDYFTFNTDREDLKYIDCVYMHLGYYGNAPEHLENIRKKIIPVFD